MIPTALIVFAVLALWGLSLLGKPLGTCRACHGRRLTHTAITHRPRPCKRCCGTGITRRLGATTIHRLYWTIRTENQRNRTPDQHPNHHNDQAQP